MILGMVAIVAINALGFITCRANFSKSFFYIRLGIVLFLGAIGTAFCMKCNSIALRNRKKKQRNDGQNPEVRLVKNPCLIFSGDPVFDLHVISTQFTDHSQHIHIADFNGFPLNVQ